MKKVSIVLFVLLTNYIIGQNVTVTFNFSKIISDSCNIVIDKYHIPEYESVNVNAVISNQSVFKLNIESPMLVKFNFKKQSINLWLEPDDDLTLNFTSDSLNTDVTMLGKAAVNNRILVLFNSTFKNDFDKNSIKKSIVTSLIDAFENNLFNEQKKQNALYDAYKDKPKVSPAFADYMSNTIKYNYYYQLLAFPIITANENKGLVVNALPELLLEKVNNTMANNDNALNCEAFRNFIYYYVIYNTSKLNGFNKFTDNSISMEKKMAFVNQSLTGKTNVYFIASFLNENVANVSPFTAKHVYGMLSYNEKSGAYTKLLKTKSEKVMNAKVKEEKKDNASTNAAGNTTGGVKILGTDGKYFTFDDLKGKVVYVDFWASWCGPCKAMFPYSKELHKKFTPKQLKNLMFLYISIDKTEEIWKNAIEQNGLGEFKNGLVPGDWASEIVKYFQISSIPRYMLIDKNGNVVELNAKRPFDEATYDDILKLME